MVYFYDKLYVIIVNSCLIIYPVVLRERFGAIGIHFPHSVAAKELYITIRVIRSFPTTWKIIPSKQWDFHGLLWTFHMILTSQNGPNRGFHDLAIKKKFRNHGGCLLGGARMNGDSPFKITAWTIKIPNGQPFSMMSKSTLVFDGYIYIHISMLSTVSFYIIIMMTINIHDSHCINGMCHGSDNFISGWWFGTYFLFFYILGIIPTG